MKFNKETISTIGLIKLASGTITDPMEFLDFELSAGHDHFLMTLNGFQVSVSYLAAALSSDGGITFYCNPGNFDTYGLQRVSAHDQETISTPAAEEYNDDDSLINFSMFMYGADLITDSRCVIFPGTAILSPRLLISSFEFYADFHASERIEGASFLNPNATIPPVLARANLIRLLPYGNGDCNPPTSGETITAGFWALFGVPTP